MSASKPALIPTIVGRPFQAVADGLESRSHAPTVWQAGADDQRVRDYLGANPDVDLRAFLEMRPARQWVIMSKWDYFAVPVPSGPVFRAVPPPITTWTPRAAALPRAGQRPYELNSKEGVEIFSTGLETWKTGNAVWEFRRGNGHLFGRFKRKGNSVLLEGNHAFRRAHRRMYRAKNYAQYSKPMQSLRLAPLTAKGLVKGAGVDILITAGGLSADYAIAWWAEDEEAMAEIEATAGKEMAKAAVGSIAATLAATAAALSGIVFLPLVAGLVVGVASNCYLDHLDGKESLCEAVWDAATAVFR
jgi:hypothetical protein